MLRMRRTVGGVASVALLSVGLAACGGGSSSSSGGGGGTGGGSGANSVNAVDLGKLKKGGSITYTIEKNIANWNVNNADGNVFDTQEVMQAIYPGAFIAQPDLSPKMNSNLLASADLTKNDPETVVYKIQQKAQWSDGTPISADDFIYDWQTQSGKNPKYNANSTTGYENIDSVVGSDNGKTVTVTFKQGKSFADWKSLFSSMLQAKAMKALPGDPVKAWNEGLTGQNFPKFSGGPYVIQSFKDNQSVTLGKNPKWYGDGPYLDTINFRILTEASQEPTALQNKEVQVIYPQPQVDLVSQVKKIQGVDARTSFGLLFEHIDMNLANPQLADKALRQAIFTAVDRQGMLNRTVKQFADQAKVLDNRMLLPGQAGYQDNVASKGLGKGDVDKAKQILTSAGYTGVGTALKDKSGKAVGPFRFRYTVGNRIRQTEGELLKADMAKLGIGLNIVPTQKLGKTLASHDFDIIVFAWVGTPFPYSSQKSIYVTKGGQNFDAYSNPQVDEAMTAAAGELDAKKAQDDLNKADGIVSDDAVTLPLYQKPTFLARYTQYGNIRDNPTSNGPTYNIQEWGEKASAS